MKLPQIATKHKIRDAKICRLWAADNISMDEIGKRFKISATRVHQIISANRHLIKIDKEYEKLKRLNHLKNLLKKHPESLGKKGTLDILDQMRMEIEGNKIEHSGVDTSTKIFILRPEKSSIETNHESVILPTNGREIALN